jgi:hypothetical protein
MAPQSNPDSPPAGADAAAADSVSADDLMALVPDIELLETSETDARTAHTAVAAAAGSGRKPTITPKLSDQRTATTSRIQAAKVAISDDPYADLMPELESFETSGSGTRTIPELQLAPAPAPKPQPTTPRETPRAAAPPLKAPVTAAVRPVAAPRPAASPAASAGKPAPAPAPAPPKAAPAARPAAPVDAKKLPNPENMAVPPVMDRDFIIRNRIVEMYLSGGLPVRSATVFEKFCLQNPQILDEIGLPERVHTGLRLLEASGKPEPWQEKPKRFWDQPYVLAAFAGLALVLGVATLVANKRLADQTHKAAALQQLVSNQPLDAATSTSTIYIQPTHNGAAAATAASIGGSAAQLVNIKIDMNHSEYRAFRITIDRTNQGRVAILNNLIKDSNGALGFALNTSALGPDVYLLTIEGLDWRGDPQPDSWGAINIRH